MNSISFFLYFLICYKFAISFRYLPEWSSIDSRPLPVWYDQAKVGLFIHWGVFSVPSFGSEWFWHYWKANETKYVEYIEKRYPPNWTYQDFAKDFDAYMFDPEWWADLIKDSGAKYVVLTSKHHEGYTMCPSNVSFSWNSVDVGPNKDIVGSLVKTIRKQTDLRIGLYHSMFEWFNPLHEIDEKNNFTTYFFPTAKTIPEMYELVQKYEPDLFWSDGDGGKLPSYWNSTIFLAWLYNDSPVRNHVVVNDRWGQGTPCKHGGYWTCADRYNPDSVISHKWENCFTLDKCSWGYRHDATYTDYLSDIDIISTLSQTISFGGNVLINIGPRKDGRIEPIMEERLRSLGRWIRINEKSIYKTKPWLHQHDCNRTVWYVSRYSNAHFYVYATVLRWPIDGVLALSNIVATSNLKISMLRQGNSLPLEWRISGKGVSVDFRPLNFYDLPDFVAWVLEIQNISYEQQQYL